MKIRIENFWPDFELKDGKPVSLSGVPRNPAVLATIFGLLPAPAETDSPLAAESTPAPAGNNQALVFVAPDGSMTYELRASATAAPVRGALKAGEPINTGWADWTLTAYESIPRAVEFTKFAPVPEKKGGKMDTAKFTEGLRVRVSKDGEVHEEWVPGGWRVSLPTETAAAAFHLRVPSRAPADWSSRLVKFRSGACSEMIRRPKLQEHRAARD